MIGRIDLNADLAEGFSYDEELLRLVSTANIALGGHAGSSGLAQSTADRCRALGVRICAHPGYPDLENMGRSPWPLESTEDSLDLYRSLRQQLSILGRQAKALKPHGALYHQSQTPGPHAAALTTLLSATSLPLIGFPGSTHEFCARASGVKFLAEGFTDRRYREGKLVSRTEPDALLTDEKEIAEQALELAQTVGTLCLHGDTPHAVEIAKLVRFALEGSGWEIGA